VSGCGLEPGPGRGLPFGAVTLTERYLGGHPPERPTCTTDHAVRREVMHECANMGTHASPSRSRGHGDRAGAAGPRAQPLRPHPDEGGPSIAPASSIWWKRIMTSRCPKLRGWPAMGEVERHRGGRSLGGEGAAAAISRPGAHLLDQGLRYGLARRAAIEIRNGATPADRAARPDRLSSRALRSSTVLALATPPGRRAEKRPTGRSFQFRC